MSASGMKLSYAQMKLSAKADKRSYVLADINTKNKSKSFDLLYFLAVHRIFEPPYVMALTGDFSPAIIKYLNNEPHRIHIRD